MEPTATVQELFKAWRNEGDAEAGMAMAQMFSDWYYAVTAARMGDRRAESRCEAACQEFEGRDHPGLAYQRPDRLGARPGREEHRQRRAGG